MIDELGREKEYQIILTFKNIIKDYLYLIYTDNTKNDLGKLNVYAAKCKMNEEKLEPISSDYEWYIIENMLKKRANNE